MIATTLELTRWGLLLFTLVALGPSFSQAAEKTGTLSVKITDSSEGPVPGAKLIAKHIRDQKTFNGTSGADGICKLKLPIGTYFLTVRAPSFRPDCMGGPRVRIDSETSVRFMLMPGDPSQKLPHEKTPEERAAELAKAQAKKGEEASATPSSVMSDTWEGLDEACKICKIERLNGGPAARAVLVQEALKLVQAGDYPKALTKYKAAIGEDASDPNSWFNCGVLFNIQRQSRPAETCFRTAIGLCGGGGEAAYHAYLGRALGAQGRLKDAEASFKSALTIDPAQEGQYAYELGCQYHSNRNFVKSEQHFSKAIEKGCSDPQVYFACGNAQEMQGKKAAAIENYKLFIEKGAKDPQIADFIERARQKLERLQKGKN